MPFPSTNASGLPEPPCSFRVLSRSLPEADLTATWMYTCMHRIWFSIRGGGHTKKAKHVTWYWRQSMSNRKHLHFSKQAHLVVLRICSLPSLPPVLHVGHRLLAVCLSGLLHGSDLRSHCTSLEPGFRLSSVPARPSGDCSYRSALSFLSSFSSNSGS